MGRGRGKGKKQAVTDIREDPGSEEEKLPIHKRRGRPQKVLKDEIEEEEEAEKIEEEEEEKEEKEENGSENTKNFISNKDSKGQPAEVNGRKRKRTTQVKGYSVKEENGLGAKNSSENPSRSVGFRQNGSRRKNKPRRAAEVGVECK